MDVKEAIITKFGHNVDTFIDVCLELAEKGYNKNIISIPPFLLETGVKSYKEKHSNEDLIKHFIKNTKEHWDEIKANNVEYIKDKGMTLFYYTERSEKENMFTKHIKDLKNILHDDEIFNEEEINFFLRLVNACIKLSEKYSDLTSK